MGKCLQFQPCEQNQNWCPIGALWSCLMGSWDGHRHKRDTIVAAYQLPTTAAHEQTQCMRIQAMAKYYWISAMLVIISYSIELSRQIASYKRDLRGIKGCFKWLAWMESVLKDPADIVLDPRDLTKGGCCWGSPYAERGWGKLGEGHHLPWMWLIKSRWGVVLAWSASSSVSFRVICCPLGKPSPGYAQSIRRMLNLGFII